MSSTPLYDDDPVRDAERAAAAYQEALGLHLHSLREHFVAVVAAQLIGEDEQPAVEALESYWACLGDDLIGDLLRHALWYGCLPVEDDARDRLLKLRDANDVTPVLEEINRG